MTAVEADGRRIALTSLDKVLWPRTGFTKRDMIDYYTRIAPVLLPHLRGRPLTLGRFPDGVEGPGFAQNECRGCPDWLETHPITLKSGVVRRYCVLEDLPSLLWVANLGTIELHPYLWRTTSGGRPSTLVLDLDPLPPAGFDECRRVALRLRELLARDGLTAQPKTSGASGLHVFAPVEGRSFAETKAAARRLAESLAAEWPGLVAMRQTRAERHGRVLVDWLQNDPMRSTVAPYSLRATPEPQVSTPLTWAEVERTLDLRFSPGDVLERVAAGGDLFAG